MKNSHSFAKRTFFALFATIITTVAFSQTAPSTWDTLPWKSYADFKLQLLNKSYVNTGVLYDRVLPIAQVDEHPGLPSNNTDTTTSEQTLQSYYEMYNSCYNTSTWLHPDSLDKLIQTSGTGNQHPIGVFLYNYNVIDSNALQDRLLDTAANGQFRDVAGRPRSPYFTYNSFFASPLIAEEQVITPGQHEFYLDGRFFGHNQAATVQQIRIDFGDGQGEWIVNNPFGTNTTLQGNNLSASSFGFVFSISKLINKTILGRIMVVIADIYGQTKEYGSPFKLFVKNTKPYAALSNCKGLQQWVIDADPTALSQINTQYGNPQVDYKGRKDMAYFYFAGNGSTCGTTVRRPIVFIDGFDPTNARGVQQIYEDYINVPATRNNTSVRFGDYMLSKGYDFIILDFKHGNDLLERNALTLVALLQRLNQTYGASYLQDITLIGPSMGSLIAQYALAYMQNKNIPSRVKTYISFDGCHQGANVPIGLQNYVEYLTKRGVLKKIKLIREGLYNGLAARQMLAHHVSANSATPAPDALRTKFLNNLAALGTYPTSCRKVALINGASNGILNPNHQGSNTDLLRIYVKRKGLRSIWGLCGDNICKIFDWTARRAPSSGTDKVASMWTLNPLFNLLFWVPPGNTNYYGTAIWNNSALDNAPGGRSANIFGSEPGNIIESNFQFLLKETLYLVTGSKRSFFSQNLNNFTMMPSYSAADLRFTNKNLYMNWSSQYLCGNTPFDYVYAPSENEQHVLVSQQGSQWFENEVSCAVADLPTFVTPQITQVTGTNPLCTSGSFQISTCKPVNVANITWTSSNTNIATVPASGNPVTVTKTGSGSVILTAKVNFCNGYSVSVSKTIQVGGPIVNIAYSQNGSCNGSYQSWSLNATSPNTVSSWQWTVDNPSSGSWNIYNPTSPSTNVSVSGGGGISVTATNSCGSTRTGVTIYSNCAGFAITASPNPATNELTISTDESSSLSKAQTNTAKNKIYRIEIVDQNGNIKKKFSYAAGVTSTKINIGDLISGTYIIHAYNGKVYGYKQIVIVH